MPRKRGMRTRPAGAQLDANEDTSPSAERLSCSSTHCVVGNINSRPTVSSNAVLRELNDSPERVGNDLAKNCCVPTHPTTAEGSDTPDFNAPTCILASQDDSCAFHSPRSLPGDEERAPQHSGLPDEGSSFSAPSEKPERLDSACEADRTRPYGSLSFQGGQLPVVVEEDEHQKVDWRLQHKDTHTQGQHQDKQRSEETVDEDLVKKSTSSSGSEGEWVRIEEPNREDAKTVSKHVSGPPTPRHAADELLGVPCEAASPAEASAPQDSAYPICIGNAKQAEEERTGTDSTRDLGVVEEFESDSGRGRQWEQPEICVKTCKTEGSISTSGADFLSRIAHHASSLARFASGRRNEQQLHSEAFSCKPDDLSAEVKTGGEREGRTFMQEMVELHRCLLEMYGGPVEDITRLALQVLPAQAAGKVLLFPSVTPPNRTSSLVQLLDSTRVHCWCYFFADDQSERRLLMLQGLFDVFCLYRSHFVSSPTDILHAEALHCQRRQLHGGCLLGHPKDQHASSSSPPESLFDAVRCAADTGGGLPDSVRLAIYGAVSLALKIVRALQLLLEVNSFRRGGEASRFALCLRLELLKLVLKMLLYALTPFSIYCDEQSILEAVGTHKEKQVGQRFPTRCSLC